MPIAALEAFKQKYPAYANKTDDELASALATKYPDAYGKLPGMVTREKVISGYNPGTQDSARMAEERPNAWSTLGKELSYAPWSDPNLNTMGKAKNMLFKPAATTLKAMGALGQSEEGLIAGAVVAPQRGEMPWELPYYKTRLDAITGKTPIEYGDITRNLGPAKPPEVVSKGLGLLASAIIPGTGDIVKGVSKAFKAGGKVTEDVANKAAVGLTSAHLTLLSREHPEAAANGIAKNWSMIKPRQSVASIESEVTGAVAKAEAGARATQRRASAIYETGLNRAKGESVLLVDAQSRPIAQQALQLGQDELGLTWGSKGKGPLKTPVLKGNKNIPGSDTLANVIDDLTKQGTTATVGHLRINLKELEGLIGSENKAVSAQASKLASALRETINAQSQTMGAINKQYQGMIKYLNPDEANKLPGAFDLLKARSQGGTKLSNFFSLPIEAKKVLTEFDAQLPEAEKFLEQLKDASTNAAFKSLKPQAGFSLMGPVAAGYLAVTNPGYLPALAGGVALSSPRASALMYKKLYDLGHMNNAIKAKFMASPAGQATEMLTRRGILAPAATRYMTRDIFGSDGEDAQQ
jgi:hypothetical protein